MNRYYEEKLPAGYSEAFAIDANDKKQGMRLQVAVIITVAALINVFSLYMRCRGSVKLLPALQ